ncbi:MAG UNVERIFIED_CONTAM: hypothetical protein LVR29_31750, partial [Microcystis novacekii LVE1205-3]
LTDYSSYLNGEVGISPFGEPVVDKYLGKINYILYPKIVQNFFYLRMKHLLVNTKLLSLRGNIPLDEVFRL